MEKLWRCETKLWYYDKTMEKIWYYPENYWILIYYGKNYGTIEKNYGTLVNCNQL